MPELLLESAMPFGKYKGKTVQSIIDDDHEYISWLVENTDVLFSNSAWKYFTDRHGTGMSDF